MSDKEPTDPLDNIEEKDIKTLLELADDLVVEAGKILTHFVQADKDGFIDLTDQEKLFIAKWYLNSKKYDTLANKAVEKPTVH